MVGQRLHGNDKPRELGERVDAFLRLQSRVRRAPGDLQVVQRDAFACNLDRAMLTRLQDQHGIDPPGEILDQRARGR